MAANPGKTKIINLALLKLAGVTSSAQQILTTDIEDSVFAAPTTAAGKNKDDVMLYCTRYPDSLKKALRDIRPKFARRYADLGLPISITEDNANLYQRADWSYMFDVPTDYLNLLRQTSQGDTSAEIKAMDKTAYSFAHVVAGDDGNSYYCSRAHTSADNASNGQPSANDGNGNWTQFSTEDGDGATWEAGKDYKTNETGRIIVSNEFSNSDGDSAYIEYLAYAVTGVGDIPGEYPPDFVEAFVTLLASEMAPWSVEQTVRLNLREEYELLVRPGALAAEARPDYEKTEISWLDARTA